MHRSGTYFTASLLQSAGLDIDQRLMEPGNGNAKGFFEGCVATPGEGLVKVAIVLTTPRHGHRFMNSKSPNKQGVTSLLTSSIGELALLGLYPSCQR